MVESTFNPFVWDESARVMMRNSYMIDMQIKRSSGAAIKINGLSVPINITIPRNPSHDIPPVTMVTAKGATPTVHRIKLDENDISFHAEISPFNCSASFQVLFRSSKKPTPKNYDHKWTFPREEGSTAGNRTFEVFVSNTQLNRSASGTHYLSVVAESEGDAKDCKQFSYLLLTYTSSCLFWDEREDRWTGHGCEVSTSIYRSCRYY